MNFDFKGQTSFPQEPIVIVNYYSTEQVNNKHASTLDIRQPSYKAENAFASKLPDQDELQLKSILAKQLMKWLLEDGLRLGDCEFKTKLSHRKLLAITRGDLGKISLFELIRSLNQFGYETRICFRPTKNYVPGEIQIES